MAGVCSSETREDLFTRGSFSKARKMAGEDRLLQTVKSLKANGRRGSFAGAEVNMT